MPAMTLPRLMAVGLALGAASLAPALTPEREKALLELTADPGKLWEQLPALAADARRTAALIQDLEAFGNLPERTPARIPTDARRAALAAAAWCKERLPGQYRAEHQDLAPKPFQAPAGATPAAIPKVIHFIWLGSPVPGPYLANIRAIAALNPDYRVQVWVDESSRVGAGALDGSQYRVRTVDQVLDLPATPEEARAIHRLAVAATGGRPNYAAASDVLRMLVLLAEGGVYLDTDTCPGPTGAACGFGQLKAKYGFLVSTQTLDRDGQFNNSPMAAVAGSPVLADLLALAGKRYRDAAHASQPGFGRGPDGQSWLYWVAAGDRRDLRLASTVFLSGPVLVADYLARLGLGWLKARDLPLPGEVQAGPPAVELFAEPSRRTRCHGAGAVQPVEDYYFLDNVYADFDLTSETFGLNHQFHNSWLPAVAAGGAAECKH